MVDRGLWLLHLIDGWSELREWCLRVFHIFNVNQSQVFVAGQFEGMPNNSGYCEFDCFRVEYFFVVMISDHICDYLWNTLCLNARWRFVCRLWKPIVSTYFGFVMMESVNILCQHGSKILPLVNWCTYVFIGGFIEQ